MMADSQELADMTNIEHQDHAAGDGKPHLTEVQRGEQLLEAERNLSLWKSAMLHKRILIHCFASFCGGMVFGYDVVINGSIISMPSFLLYFGEITPTGSLYLPSIWNSLWVAMSYLLQAFGAAGSGLISDRIGRRWTSIAASLFSVAGVAVQYTSTTRGMLLAGKIVNGLAIGSLATASTAWAAEVSPARLRGPVQSTIVLFTTFMQGLALGVVRIYVPDISEGAFRIVLAIQWAWCIATALAFLLVPESPNWLILKERPAAARASLARLYGARNEIDARLAAMTNQIEKEIREQHADQSIGTYASAFRGSNRLRTLTVIWIFVCTGLNGAAFLSQNIYILFIAGLEPIHAFDIGIGGFALAVLAIIASWVYMEKLGRRSLYLIGCVGNVVIMAIIGGLYYSSGIGSLWASAVLMNILISWQIVSMLSPGWSITGEISAFRLRGKTQAVAVITLTVVTWLFLFIMPYIYNTDAGDLGLRTGLVFAGSSVVMFVVSFFIIPDLAGFTTEEVDWLYENHIPVRQFYKYKGGVIRDNVAAGQATAEIA